jgi:hypothetical protein
MKKVVVIIPIYKPELNDLETLSFCNNVKVLALYDIVAIHPEGLDLSFYEKLAPDLGFKSFAPNFFEGLRGYNRLMIAPWFYKAFSKFEYLLICHTDAWVFEDRLLSWCEEGYDCVAAPFLTPFQPGPTSRFLPFLRNVGVGKIGNGGLALRKVSTHIKAARRLRPFSLFYFYNEDVFWAELPRFVCTFKTPPVGVANRFSARMSYPGGILDEKGGLPFGCHGWFRPNEIEFWKKYIMRDDV